MSELVVISVFAAVLLIGVLRLVGRLLHERRKRRFAEEYLSKLRLAVQEEGTSQDRFNWLLSRAARMQAQLGRLGMKSLAATPYTADLHFSQGLLESTVPQLRSGTVGTTDIKACEDALVVHLGELEESRSQCRKQLINPVIWYAEGVRFLLLLPLYIMHWLGLLNQHAFRRLTRSTLFSVFSGMLAIVALAAGIAILIQGWEAFLATLAEWMTRIGRMTG